MRHIVIPIFIPHKGCPFDCIYCNQKTISGEINEMSDQRMRDIIEGHLHSIKEEAFIEIGFYGGSFTGIEREQQILFLKTANEYFGEKGVKAIRLSTRPDYISREILEYLVLYNVKTIELGVQSLDREVLLKSCRGHGIKEVKEACRLIKEYGIELGIQTMIGLPGDSPDRDLDTAKSVVEMQPKIARIYPTLVIKGTYLEKMYLEGGYEPLSLEQAVAICAKLMDIYEENGINVIRVGLQPTESINENMDVIAGPFHPAFRQLVESKRMLCRVEEEIVLKGVVNKAGILIYTSRKNISNVVGQNKSNINELKKRFGYEKIYVLENGEFCGKQIAVMEIPN